jgi:hypothetical protein
MNEPKPLLDEAELPESALAMIAGGASDYVMPPVDDP